MLIYTLKSLILCATLTARCCTEQLSNIDANSPYFNTSFLLNYNQVKERLIQDGFRNFYFNAADHHKLQALWLERDDHTSNVLICSGFYPGRKEGAAAFYHLLPETCNILLFDARGHGASEGYFLSNLHNYGAHEYMDILGALAFIKSKSSQPIIIIGICAGAFHTVKALHHIQIHELNHLMPSGAILDSSILSLYDAFHVPGQYLLTDILPNLLRTTIYKHMNKLAVKESLLYKACALCCKPFILLLEALLYPITYLRRNELDLHAAYNEISIPIGLIHAKNDLIAPWQDIQALQSTAYHYWWPKQAKHACIYLQHKETYKTFLHTFIADISRLNKKRH
jgi:pimeloyl-ACP methyl ester carboxylesterase